MIGSIALGFGRAGSHSVPLTDGSMAGSTSDRRPNMGFSTISSAAFPILHDVSSNNVLFTYSVYRTSLQVGFTVVAQKLFLLTIIHVSKFSLTSNPLPALRVPAEWNLELLNVRPRPIWVGLVTSRVGRYRPHWGQDQGSKLSMLSD